jgi:hypothetical protein
VLILRRVLETSFGVDIGSVFFTSVSTLRKVGAFGVVFSAFLAIGDSAGEFEMGALRVAKELNQSLN